MQQSSEANGEQVIGWCPHCKCAIYENDEDKLIRRHKVWHAECWALKYNRPKECKFE